MIMFTSLVLCCSPLVVSLIPISQLLEKIFVLGSVPHEKGLNFISDFRERSVLRALSVFSNNMQLACNYLLASSMDTVL